MVNSAELRRGSIAFEGFLNFFGGCNDQVRNDAVNACANLGVEVANDPVMAEALINAMRALGGIPQFQAEMGNVPASRAAKALIALVIVGAHCAKAALDQQIVQNLNDTILPDLAH